MLSRGKARAESGGDVVSPGIAVDIQNFTGKIEPLFQFGFHRFRMDLFQVNSSAGDKSFLHGKGSVDSKGKSFQQLK